MSEPIVEPQTPAVAPAAAPEGPPQIEGLELQTPADPTPSQAATPSEVEALQKANAGLIRDLQKDRLKRQEMDAAFKSRLDEINASINAGREAPDADPMPDPEQDAAEFLKWSHRNLGERIDASIEKDEAKDATAKQQADLEAEFASVRVSEETYITENKIPPEEYAGKVQAVRNLRMQMHVAAGANEQEARQAVAVEEFNLIRRAVKSGQSVPQMAMDMFDSLAAGATPVPQPTVTTAGPDPAAVIAATAAGQAARSPVAENGGNAGRGVLTNASLANLSQADYNKMVTYLKADGGDRWKTLQTTGSVQL